jgi:hypothetical protein
MRYVIILFAIILVACSGKVEQAETAYKSELKEFIPLKGHDPYEEGLLTHPYLKHRLVKMLGEGKYDTLKRVMFDCSPIGFNNDLLYWVGYGPEQPERNSGAIIIDLVNDEIYIGYEYGDAIEVFTDAPTERDNPTRLASWLNRRSRIINLADTTSQETQ